MSGSSDPDPDLYVVTGAFGYSGKYIAARLLADGKRVRTLTNSPRRGNPFGAAVEAHPYNFDRPDELTRSLRGSKAVVNTYWVRFDRRDLTHAQAVRNSLTLFEAATRAEVPRIVHVSITNPSADSRLPYFRGKAELEVALRASGLSYAILRPTVLFGREDILINNIAWMLRHFPVFGVFGDGSYRLQPVYVDDLARLAVEAAAASEKMVLDATGPETFTYRELVTAIGRAIGTRRPLVNIPPGLGVAFGRLVGSLVGDVVITPEEVAGLMQNLLVTMSPPAGRTALSRWLLEHGDSLGRRYSSELARRRDREKTYEELRRGSQSGAPSHRGMKRSDRASDDMIAPVFQQAARLVVVRPDNRVLLFRHEDEGRSWWAAPGGGLEGNETFEEAAAREAAEELSITGASLTPLWSQTVEFRFRGESIRQVERFFLMRLSGGETGFSDLVREAHRREGIVASRWWSLDEVVTTSERIFPEDLAKRLRALES